MIRVRMLVALAVCGLVLGCLPPTARAADIDLPTYVQRLTAARDALMQAQSLAGPSRDAAIRRAQDALAGIDGVTVDGTRSPAQHADILAALRASPPDPARALAGLNALIAPLVAERDARPDTDARRTLDTVLSDRAFRAAEPNIIQKQAIRFEGWLGAQIRRLFSPLNRLQPRDAPRETPGAGPIAGLLALLGSPELLIAVALVLAAALAIVLLRRRRRPARRPAGDAPPAPRTAAEWRAHADALAARGEYRAAVRALFLGTLTDLDARRLVAFDAALTDREYLREAQRQQGWLVDALRPFVRLVETVVYAGAPCRAAEYERARALTDDVCARVDIPRGVTV